MTEPVWQSEAGARPDAEVLDSTPTGAEEAVAFATPEERYSHELHNRKLELENRQFERDMDNREAFADRAYSITITWITFILVLTAAQFFLGKSQYSGLSEKGFIVVITTTTASMFGFWVLVGRYLFHRGQSGESALPGIGAKKTPMRKTRTKR